MSDFRVQLERPREALHEDAALGDAAVHAILLIHLEIRRLCRRREAEDDAALVLLPCRVREEKRHGLLLPLRAQILLPRLLLTLLLLLHLPVGLQGRGRRGGGTATLPS